MKEPENAVEHLAFLDRIEGDTAVLLLGPEGDRTLNVPRDLLPKGTGEGAHLLLRLRPHPEREKQVAGEVNHLMDELLGGGAGSGGEEKGA